MINKIFISQNTIIKTITKYGQSGEPAQVILNSIKELNIDKHPLEAIVSLQWILESLLKKVLEKNNVKHSNIISKNLKEYFKKYPHSLLDKQKILSILNIRNDAQHFGKIRDNRMCRMINAYILSIEFIAIEADIDLNRFIPPSSNEQIQQLIKENQIEEEKEKKKSYLKYWILPLVIITIFISSFLAYSYYHKIYFLTGFKGGTYYKMATQLKENYEDDIDVISSEGSEDNLRQLGKKKIRGFAFVQEDVLTEFAKEAKDRKDSYKRMLNNIYLLKPIVKGEIHILVKKDSSMQYFRDLEDKKIAIGAEYSGNAITSRAIYKQLFSHKEFKGKRYYANFQESLNKLQKNELDAIIVVGGEPLTKLTKLKGVKLLSYKQNKPLSIYEIGTIDKNSYSWLQSDIKTLMVTSFLITNIEKKSDVKKLLSVLDKLKNSVQKNKAINLHKKWIEFSKFRCLPSQKNRIIYHSTTRMGSYCSEDFD
jgi:TRAP transporter TAXI family solute receptor